MAKNWHTLFCTP